MTELKMAVAAALVLAAAACGQDIRHLRRIHEDTWRVRGAVCAHAAVAVHDAARGHGLASGVMLFEMAPGEAYKRHAIPIVYQGGEWHAIDSLRSVATGRYVGHSRRTRSPAEQWDPVKVSRFARRRMVRFLGYAGDGELLQWRDELEAFRAARSR
jgi:GNAT superfamily N-acetyltransferase